MTKLIPHFCHKRDKILIGISRSQFLSIGLTSLYHNVVGMLGQAVQCRIGHDLPPVAPYS